MSKIKPLADKVLIKPLEGEEQTKSGIVLPETAQEKPQEGKVMAVGEGKWIEGKLVPLSVKTGDKILYSKYGGDEIKVENIEYKILKEEDILAIIE